MLNLMAVQSEGSSLVGGVFPRSLLIIDVLSSFQGDDDVLSL